MATTPSLDNKPEVDAMGIPYSQKAKHLMWKLGVVTDMNQGILTDDMASKTISNYINAGWKLFYVQAFGTDLTAVNMVYVLIRDPKASPPSLVE